MTIQVDHSFRVWDKNAATGRRREKSCLPFSRVKCVGSLRLQFTVASLARTLSTHQPIVKTADNPPRGRAPIQRVAFVVLAATVLANAPKTSAQNSSPAALVLDSAAHPEVLLGRVVTDSGRPISGAQIIVTRGPDRLSQTTTTDADGRWTTRFSEGTGDYLVYVAAAGWKTFRKRVTRSPNDSAKIGPADSLFVVNASLQKNVSELQAVIIQANKARPDRSVSGPVGTPRPGADERSVDDFYGALPPDLAGDFGAKAATIPGVVLTPQGPSVLGLSPEQTNSTLGGLQFLGTRLPRDARTFTRVTTSTYDPARGWFGGSQIMAELSPGSAYSLRHGHLTLDARPLQLTDAGGLSLGQRFQAIDASYGGEGGLADDRLAYNVGIEVRHRSQDAASLLNVRPDALLLAGISSDSVARLLSLLAKSGVPAVPIATSSEWARNVSSGISWVGRLGNPLYDYKKFEVVRHVAGVTGFADWSDRSSVGISPTSTPTRGGQVTNTTAGIQGLYSAYLTSRDWLLELRSGLSESSEKQRPYVTLPGAELFLGAAPQATSYPELFTLTPITFGGNGFLQTNHRSWLWESLASFAFYPPGRNRHQLALTADLRLDGVNDEPSADRFGTYLYQSLDDLEANRPSGFSRDLSVEASKAKVWNGFVSLGDEWQVSPALKVLYGLRVEGDAYATPPLYNPLLDASLGVRTDLVPNRIAISPRFGFTWRRTALQDGYTNGPFGTFRLPYSSVIRGGIGEFRNVLAAPLVAQVASATGLSGASQHVSCIGPAVPATAWSGWLSGVTSLPSACASGAPESFADAAPSVIALDKSYSASRSWRANLGWSGILSELVYNIDGIYSLNLNQSGTTDANFSGIPRFFLTDENRPIYVSANSIVASTGALSPEEGRKTSAFSSVVVEQTNLRSWSRQLAITITPYGANLHRWWGSASYVLARTDQEAYGFDKGAFQDPRLRESSRGDLDVRHQFLLQGGIAFKAITATLFGRFTSGLPYTPLVGTDINGDGLVNDRAFVFRPLDANGDSLVSSQMQALLAAASPSTRDCLNRSLGSVAGRNSCEGPWTASLNARIGIDGAALRLGERTNIAINLANPLGALDQLFHRNRLRGWGQPAFPDPVLLWVRGFDQTTSRFKYSVNSHFGNTRPRSPLLRVPFRITLDISIDLAPPLVQQQLNKWLAPGRRSRGTRMSAAEIAKRYARNTPDPYGAIMQQADSLLLTPAQIKQLQAAEVAYRARTDSVWATLADTLGSVGDSYDVAELTKRQNAVADTVWGIARADVKAIIPTILTPIQIKLMPGQAATLYFAKGNEKRRYFFF